MSGPLRRAQTEDLPALAALHGLSFAASWSAGGMGQLLALPGTFALLAEDGGGVRGFVLARVAADEAEILTLAVHPAWRRQGLARQLMQAAARQAQMQGAAAVLLEVGTSNMGGRQLYAALGFRQVGQRKAYYAPDAPGDALILKRSLPLAPIGETG